MGNYKIPQDVEAEDKLLGPFTFRQFIFLLIAAAGIFLGWLLSTASPWLALIPLPVVLVFGLLGLYRREDQPVEVYLMAALNFLVKPRKRVWNPEGHLENVKLVAPPKIDKPKLKKLENEERGQLQKLAHVMDTRGWSVKRPELNDSAHIEQLDISDRLVNPTNNVGVEPLDVRPSDDVFDPINFPDAQKFQQLAESSSLQAKARAIKQMKQASQLADGSKQAVTGGDNEDPASQTPNQFTPTEASGLSPNSPAPHLALHRSDHLSIEHVAKQAARLNPRDGELQAGQEIELHQSH